MKKVIGIDVGGTEIKIALVCNDGKIEYSKSYPTEADKGFEVSCYNIKTAIENLFDDTEIKTSEVKGIGIGLPGMINHKLGIVKTLPNVKGWNNVNLAEMISKEFNLETRLDNDVNCATLAELKYGAGVGAENIVCITIGTGIGSGIICNGQMVRGINNVAGEIGHIKLHTQEVGACGCGDFSCFETFASGGAIVALANKKGLELNSPRLISEAAYAGDKVAKSVYDEIGEYIGIGLSSVINLLNPEKIIIGGGIAKAGDILFEPIIKTINKRALPHSLVGFSVVKAKLGNDAGVIGASLLID